MIPLPLRCRRCAVRPAASAWSPDGRSRPGSPVMQSCSAGKARLRKPGSPGFTRQTARRAHTREVTPEEFCVIPLPLRCRRYAVHPAASAWSPDGRSRPGFPVIQSCSAGKARLRKPGSAGIYAPNGAARTCARGHARRILRYSSSFAVQTMCSSSSCFCVTSEGAPMRISCAFLFIGNGIISRMDSSPASSMTMRSTPGAMPA